ncbi:MAG: ABC transporter permease [Lachnospiraceae bacterium]|nr:ABC transporter permease [Lachnospiraceae bacterium]
MFKNFDKVFKFTFKNQVSGKGYKIVTIVIALLCLLVPAAIFTAIGFAGREDTEVIEGCAAGKVYVVDEYAPQTDFSMLRNVSAGDINVAESYEHIVYVNAASTDKALDEIHANGEVDSMILLIEKDEDGDLVSRIIIPDGSVITVDHADHFNDYMEYNSSFLTVLASGVPMESVVQVSRPVENDVYTASGYAKGEDIYSNVEAVTEQENNEVKPIFGMILMFVSMFVIYFVILMYGNNIMQTVILEKTNKLMDTMLVSINPTAMIFGKMAGVLAAGFMQLLLWIAALAGGLAIGVNMVFVINPEAHFSVLTFLTSLDTQGLFTPLGVIAALFTLICGVVMYASLSAMCGAISSTREEAASNQSTFVIILLVAFYAILFKGLTADAASTWLYLVPFTSAMMLPSAICMGDVSAVIAAAGIGIMVLMTAAGLVLAGKLYSFMSLYKGNKVNLSKALKMLFSK